MNHQSDRRNDSDSNNFANFNEVVRRLFHVQSGDVLSERKNNDGNEAQALGLKPRERFGDFRIVEKIGHGGFGDVYKALFEPDGSIVALKLPRADRIVSHEIIRRFRRESELSAGLLHPNIVPVQSFGQIDSMVYLATEFQEGVDLRLWMNRNRGQVDLKQVIGWAISLLDGLQYAFEKGVVHRDLKPSNILMSQTKPPGCESMPSGEMVVPRITDFGLAYSVVTSSPDSSGYGRLVGTLTYMAPEQYLKPESRPDIRGDIYSLGMIVAELLLDRPLHQYATQYEILIELSRSGRVHNLSPLRRRIPQNLFAILQKATETDPEKRYLVPLDFRDDLQRFLDGKRTEAKAPTALQLIWSSARRNPLISLVVLISVIYFSFFMVYRFRQQETLIATIGKLKEKVKELDTANMLLGRTQKRLSQQNYNS
jgi:serine/threonine protein kinase